MAKHENGKGKNGKDQAEAKSVAADALPSVASASEDGAGAAEATKVALATVEMSQDATPRMALASVVAPTLAPKLDTPKIEVPKLEMPKLDLPMPDTPKVEAPKLAMPRAEPIEPARGSAQDNAAPQPIAADAAAPDTGEPPRMSRFTLLAASLVLCAAFGAMIGTLIAAGITRPVPVAAVAEPSPGATAQDFNALKEQLVQARVDLANLKASIDAGHRTANTQFSKIGERVDRIERAQAEPVAKINRAIEAFERRAQQSLPQSETTGAIAAPPAAGAAKEAPAKPAIIDGWILRGVYNGVAYVESRMGLMEVEQGDVIPGIGRVEAVRKQDGRWVVVTSKGLIAPSTR
jgi:hypothetical protein